MKGDNVCDEVLNTPQCQFDGGDCDGVSTEPTGPTTSTSSVVKFQNCSTQDWIIEMWYDDGGCDEELNNPECGYDGSDCYDEVPSTTVANSFPNCNPPVWVLTIWIGDGVCDTQLNNPDCGNDEGDCDDGIASTIQPITTTQPNNCNPPQPFMIQWIGRYCKSDKILKTTFSLYLSHER